MISIIIPTFNREDKIIQVINSLLNQNVDEYEIIVVDDGSTDSTMDKLNIFSRNKKTAGKFCDSHSKKIKCEIGYKELGSSI